MVETTMIQLNLLRKQLWKICLGVIYGFSLGCSFIDLGLRIFLKRFEVAVNLTWSSVKKKVWFPAGWDLGSFVPISRSRSIDWNVTTLYASRVDVKFVRNGWKKTDRSGSGDVNQTVKEQRLTWFQNLMTIRKFLEPFGGNRFHCRDDTLVTQPGGESMENSRWKLSTISPGFWYLLNRGRNLRYFFLSAPLIPVFHQIAIHRGTRTQSFLPTTTTTIKNRNCSQISRALPRRSVGGSVFLN